MANNEMVAGYRPYHGYDYSELQEALNLPYAIDNSLDHNVLQEYISTVLRMRYTRWHKRGYVMRRTAYEVREYVKVLAAVASEHHYDGPLWRGLAEIEDDEVMLQYFRVLCPLAWT